jgi:hypothetical protein
LNANTPAIIEILFASVTRTDGESEKLHVQKYALGVEASDHHQSHIHIDKIAKQVQDGKRIKAEQCDARDLVKPQAGIIVVCDVIRADFADKGQATGRNA